MLELDAVINVDFCKIRKYGLIQAGLDEKLPECITGNHKGPRDGEPDCRHLAKGCPLSPHCRNILFSYLF